MTSNMTSAERLDAAITDAQQMLFKQYGNLRDDYYGLVFFENILKIPRTEAVGFVTFGNHDLGIDGFCFDEEQETFRIFQFKNSSNAKLFGQSFESLIERGINCLFGEHISVPNHQPIVDEARKALGKHKGYISQILIDFVFRGDPQEAEQSSALSNLKDKLEDMSWLVERYFGERIPLLVRFLPFDGLAQKTARDSFKITLDQPTIYSDGGMQMYVGFVPLYDLYGIRSALGRKFLERNIRFALPPDGQVNRSLSETFSSIFLKRDKPPSIFAFHHNGVTLSAGMVEQKGAETIIHAPRLLNGAQTVSTFADFWDRNGAALKASSAEKLIDQLKILTRIVVNAKSEEVTQVTISNNRQNPVQAWQLHANDQIQFELEDWFRNLGIPYQRQERTFAKVSAEDWQNMEYTETRAVELIRLARTYLAAEGELGKLAHIKDVFENGSDYNELFGRHRLNADPRKVLLCYKAQFNLPRLVSEIKEKGKLKYDFVNRTREIIWSLVCQAMLNSANAEAMAEEFGNDLSRPFPFIEKLRELASTRVRFLLDDLTKDKEYKAKVDDGNYGFMRSQGAYKKAMKYANGRWGWKTVLLR